MRRRVLALRSIVVLGAALLAYNPDVNGNLDLLHEGDRLAHWDALQDGRLPFRDIYVQQGFGENILKPAFACWLYGPSVESLRRVGQNAFVYRGFLPPLGVAAALIAAAAMSRRLLPLFIAAAVMLAGLCEATDRHMLGLLSVACAAMSIGGSRRRLFPAGLLGAWAALYSLDVGLFASTAVLGWLLLDGLFIGGDAPCSALATGLRAAGARLAVYLAGFVAGMLPFAAWCARHGIMLDFLRNVHTQLFLRGEVLDVPYPMLQPHPALSFGLKLLAWLETTVLFYAIPGLFAGALIMAVGARQTFSSQARSRLALCGLLGMCFWMAVMSRPDHWHVATTTSAFALLTAVLADTVCLRPATPGGRPVRLRYRLPATGLLTIVAISLGLFGFGGVIGRRWFGLEMPQLPPLLATRGKTLVAADLPRVGRIAMEPLERRYVTFMLHNIRELAGPDDTILDLSDQGLIYFLSERRCPTRFHLKSHWGGSRVLQQQVLDDVLRRDKLPKCVIVYRGEPPGDLFGPFLSAYYAPHARAGQIEVLQCIDPAAHRRGGISP